MVLNARVQAVAFACACVRAEYTDRLPTLLSKRRRKVGASMIFRFINDSII